jgi:hypothetical protein
MKKILITLILGAFLTSFVYGQDAITSLSTTILDETLSLTTKDKKTYSQQISLEIPADFWNQFERIDAVYISYWLGVGDTGLEIYKKDSANIEKESGMSPILYYAEKNPKTFTRPTNQTGFGLEFVLMRGDTNEKCEAKYTKKKISPRGFYPCVIKRQWATTATDFLYRFALPKEHYVKNLCPEFKVFLRTSSKADTVIVHSKIALTIQGKRHAIMKLPSVDEFMETAVLEGLKADGFPLDQAKWVMQNENKLFVGKCPICTPTEDAFREYIQDYSVAKIETPNDILIGLSKDNTVDMQKAFSQLISRYVDMHFERLELHARDKSEMLKELEAARKVGMSRKSDSFGAFCPSCDGACKVKH